MLAQTRASDLADKIASRAGNSVSQKKKSVCGLKISDDSSNSRKVDQDCYSSSLTNFLYVIVLSPFNYR